MRATADEIAEWLMLARDRALHASGSMLQGSADVYAAGELIARLADALTGWEQWRVERITEQAAHARRILAAAAFRWGGDSRMFRQFVADRLDADVARRLGEKEIAVLACALRLRRKGRPSKTDDATARLLKEACGLSHDDEVPDKFEALQRLAASVGIQRLSPDAVEDQVQPLLAQMAQIRKDRESAFEELAEHKFESEQAAFEAYEDADVLAMVREDGAVRSCGTRRKAPRSQEADGSVSRKSRRHR